MSEPLTELSVRQPAADGTEVADRVAERPEGFHPKSHRLILFIHGYNNTHAEAAESYAHFRKLLEDLGVKSPSLTGEICAVHWPGNRKLGFLSFVSYPLEIKPAIDSGERLADYLVTLVGPQGAPLEIFLVCHSLGSRVGLELLHRHIEQRRQPSPRSPFAGVCLMAAAVPVQYVEDGRLAAAARFTRTRVLYSRRDIVVCLAFPVGQTLAGDGFFPQAVGRDGQPVGAWSERADLAPYGHFDYWRGGKKKKPDPRSAREVAAFLGVPVARDLAANELVDHELPPPAAPAENSLATRTVEGRRL